MMWDAIDLSICSINEVCVGIIIANLPPLRKTILRLFSRVLPPSYASNGGVSRKHTSQFLPISSHFSSKGLTKLDNKDDDESERHILELEDTKQDAGIMKTMQVSVRDGDAQSQKTPSLKQHF
jgi:hypothetical protein